MLDIHCHILHGVDDGAADLEESIAMAQIAYADGVRHIAVTPHFTPTFEHNHHAAVSGKTKALQAELDARGIGITLHPANEVRIESVDFVIRHAEAGTFGYLDTARRFVLIEQRWSDYEPETQDLLSWFRERGTTAVMAHPERHGFFRSDPKLVESLVAAGVWTQVSVDSLIGRNGEEARAFADWMLERDLVHTLATDAHNVRRKPNLAEGVAHVRARVGNARADAIMERLDAIRSGWA